MDLVPENLGGAVVFNLVNSCGANKGVCGNCADFAVAIHNWLMNTEVRYVLVDLQDEKEICPAFLEELLQLAKLGRMDLTEQDAVELAERKTACLFAGCARLGAVLGNLGESGEQAMADYGRYAGLAFQLVDDLLDFTASPEKLGKPVLSDLKEGKVTLPLIYALESDGAAGRRLVSTVLEEKGFESVRPEQITALVQESGALERTRAAAHDFASRAKACLNGNAVSDFGRALRTVPDFILDRDN